MLWIIITVISKLNDETFLRNGSCGPIDGDLNELISVEHKVKTDNVEIFSRSELQAEEVIGDEKDSCDKYRKEEIMASRLAKCDYYGITNSECVKYINNELKSSCGGAYNCIVTDWNVAATYRTYHVATDQ